MNTKELNKISIKNYLASKGIHPVKEHGYYGMYHSPLREDKNASFKVDYVKNLWIDFGTNQGSTMIDLVMRLKECSVHEAMLELEQMDSHLNIRLSDQPANRLASQPSTPFSFHGKIEIQRAIELTHPALLQYLDKRAINLDIAKQHCSEIHYSVNGKPFFAIGFQNDSKGWNLRSEYFKGCTSMDISTHINAGINKEACLVFEGFMDYLSYLTMNNLKKSPNDIVVLNSTSNLSKALDFIKAHSKVYTYLDNDEAGRKATQQINQICKTHFNKSTDFTHFKDLNEYHVANKKTQKQEVKRKPSRGFRR